jgi:hypothetical protein
LQIGVVVVDGVVADHAVDTLVVYLHTKQTEGGEDGGGGAGRGEWRHSVDARRKTWTLMGSPSSEIVKCE